MGGLLSPKEGLCFCKFARTLQDLRPTPPDWNTYKGHYWEQGKPLPDQEVLDLIEAYAEISSPSQVPQWVHDLRASREKGLQRAARMSPPWKRARREEEEAAPALCTPPWQVQETPNSSSTDTAGTGDSQEGAGEKDAEPGHDASMALLIPVVKAILGYTNLKWPTREDYLSGACS